MGTGQNAITQEHHKIKYHFTHTIVAKRKGNRKITTKWHSHPRCGFFEESFLLRTICYAYSVIHVRTAEHQEDSSNLSDKV